MQKKQCPYMTKKQGRIHVIIMSSSLGIQNVLLQLSS